ncbi:MAG: hypothetical protein JW699_05105, partial [Chitinispirillaceae bacterium]|nr:hypothetical protein [Chitinispirillaceae bacterium]
ETELWPSMLHACFCRNIPVGIANARMEERSFARYMKWKSFLRLLLEKLDIVLVQNETYAQRFFSLGARKERVHIVGNMKTHVLIRAPRPDERERPRAALHIPPDDIVITAGCFHAGEGALLRAALDKLGARGRTCRCIVVPRHLRECDALAAELGDGILRLRDASTRASWTICLVEKMGILEPMYRAADAAIVGGTFIDIGGHNVWEPAQAAIPVFFGPYHYEQRSGCEKLLAAGIGFLATDADELARELEQALWTGKAAFSRAHARFAEETNSREALLEPLIP